MLRHLPTVCGYVQRDLDGLTTLLKSTSTYDIPKTLLYVSSKNMACKIYHFLKIASSDKHSVGIYHADLTRSYKSSVCQQFSAVTSRMRCLVATVAFGMVCVPYLLVTTCPYMYMHVHIMLVYIGDGCSRCRNRFGVRYSTYDLPALSGT